MGNSVKKEKNNKGITIIALVVTIIILLILAGITIASVTGEKGLIREAKTAKELTEKAALEELVELAVIKAEQKHRNPTIDNVIEELKINKVISKEEQVNKETGNIITDAGYEITGRLDDYIGKVSEGGDDNNPTPNPPIVTKPTTIQEGRIAGIVVDETEPSILTDTYGNKVKIPEGFKIAEDSADEVTGGVVIEDVSHGETAESQFVWIPVGTIYTNPEKTTKTITLDRYTFDSNGNPTAQGEKQIETYFRELATSNYGNDVATDINAFKASAISNGGYYIGRYETRTDERRKSVTDVSQTATVKADGYVYMYAIQAIASSASKYMYREKKFTSDLVNSYAWDTAIVFLQTFDDRTNKQTPYSQQTTLNHSFAEKGTNNLTDETLQDKICNIWDMASNDSEWTTETYSNESYPCVYRGGGENMKETMSKRAYHRTMWALQNISFRTLLYL